MDLRRICGLGMLLLIYLLWVEATRREGRYTFFNKVAVEDLWSLYTIPDLQALLAGHGGEGRIRGDAISSFPAGLGGEGEFGGAASLYAPATRSRLVDGLHRWGFLLLPSSLPHHGGEMEDGEAEGPLGWCHLMPTGCYFDKLQQAVGVLAAAIHGRKGGPLQPPMWRP
jgi:hypothetical protein